MPLNPGLTEISTPSPSAGAISKFGSIPVGPSTGIPSISIPIYAHIGKIKNVDLSVSLDYHAGGVKVDEIASNAGLGWTLNAGGAITRVVRGIPDEVPLRGFFNSPALPQYIDDGNQPGTLPSERPFNKIYNYELDNQNDIFSFNFNGRTGKFVFGKDEELLMLSQQKLIINKEIANVSGRDVIVRFTVVDEKGVKYYFSDYEITNNIASGAYNLNGFTSAWYLSKIVSPSGQDSIMFQYESSTIFEYFLSRSFSEVRKLRQGGPGPSYSAAFARQGHEYSRRLKKISFPDGIAVDLVYDVTNRTDYPDKALKEVTVSDLHGSSRGVKLLHDYSLGRLTLIRVTPFNPVDGLSTPYDLEYLGGLPERFSMQQDHWGFANDNSSNTLIPEEYYNGTLYPGGNRSTSSSSGKAGSLRKMSYPTGGYTIFDLEVNEAKDEWLTNSSVSIQPQLYVGGLRARKISDYDGISPDPVQIKEYKYLMEDGVTSSGALGTYPEYSNPVYYMFREDAFMPPNYFEYYQASEYNGLLRGSSSIYDLSYANGNPVTYQRVVEQHIDKNNVSNGKIVRTFTSFANNRPNIPMGFPFTPPYNYEWTYGLLKEEYVYDKNNVLLKETRNEYGTIHDNFYQTPGRYENFRCITIAPVKYIVPDIFNPVLGGAPVYFDMNSFIPVAGRSELIKSMVFEYASSGTGVLKKETTFQYDQSNYYLTTETTTNSEDEVIVKQYRYPKEMISAGRDPSGVYQQMVNKNIISPLVENVLLKNGVESKVVRNNYASFYPNVLEPQTTVLKNGSFPEKTVARYYAYDTKGNQLSASKEDDIRISYIWDYNKVLPYAITRNASEQDIAYTSFEMDGKGNWNSYTGTITAVSVSPFPPTGKKYYNITTANKLSKTVTNGKVYIISYWRNSSVPFTINGGNEAHTTGSTVNGWTFHKHTVTATSTLLEITGSGAIDEVRLYPEKAQMATYTYEALHGVTSLCDDNSHISYYEYDAFGRLKLIRDQNNKILKQFNYQYKAPITQ